MSIWAVRLQPAVLYHHFVIFVSSCNVLQRHSGGESHHSFSFFSYVADTVPPQSILFLYCVMLQAYSKMDSLFSSKYYKQYPIMTTSKRFVWNLSNL